MTAQQVIESGVVGVNIEDGLSWGGTLRTIEDQCQRIATLRQGTSKLWPRPKARWARALLGSQTNFRHSIARQLDYGDQDTARTQHQAYPPKHDIDINVLKYQAGEHQINGRKGDFVSLEIANEKFKQSKSTTEPRPCRVNIK